MTKENIIARIDALSLKRDNLLAQLNQLEGAIFESKYWLEELGKEGN